MDGLMGCLLPTCDPHHHEMHSFPLQMSQDPEGVRDLSKVTKQKMADLEPLHPLPPFVPTHPLSRFILLPPPFIFPCPLCQLPGLPSAIFHALGISLPPPCLGV